MLLLGPRRGVGIDCVFRRLRNGDGAVDDVIWSIRLLDLHNWEGSTVALTIPEGLSLFSWNRQCNLELCDGHT